MNTPNENAQLFAELGVKKTETPVGKLLLLAVLAGIYIALAGVGSTIAGAAVNKLAGACVFPAGLAMVVVAGSELFTGDNLMIISLLEKKITAGRMAAVLVLVYAGNLAGALLVAVLAHLGGTLGAWAEAVTAAAAAKASMGFGAAFVRGILCNVLVCAAVWMAAAARDAAGKIAALYLPVMVFVLCGFEHCVANMYYLPAGLLTAARYGIEAEGLTWGSALCGNLIPATLGNLVGGMGMGVCCWAVFCRKT